jgi:hypothetical protein
MRELDRERKSGATRARGGRRPAAPLPTREPVASLG